MQKPLHVFEHEGKTYKFYPDEMHETRGSYAYDDYVIRLYHDDGCYWSNKDGWGDLASASVFTKTEKETLNLPIGGEWLNATVAAEDEEIAKLNSGEWIVIGIVVSEPCTGILPVDGKALHCSCCKEHGSMVDGDSCWGIVIENDWKAWEQYAKEGF
jgi:hypothetical protein